MATKIGKPLRRETDIIPNASASSPEGWGVHKGRKIIIELEAPCWITFRLKGTRQSFQTDVLSCFRVAQYQQLREDYKERLAKWKSEKALGSRKKKPAAPYFPLNL